MDEHRDRLGRIRPAQSIHAGGDQELTCSGPSMSRVQGPSPDASTCRAGRVDRRWAESACRLGRVCTEWAFWTMHNAGLRVGNGAVSLVAMLRPRVQFAGVPEGLMRPPPQSETGPSLVAGAQSQSRQRTRLGQRVSQWVVASWIWATALAQTQPAIDQVQLARLSSDPASARLAQATSAVVRLQMLDRAGAEVGHGTGFFIRPDGVLVTARHVSEGAGQLVAVKADGAVLPVTGFFGDDCDFDVAVLKVENTNLPCLTLAETVRPNEWVGVVAAPATAEAPYATGRVAQVLELGDVLKHIVTTVPVQRGHSGAPLLNAAGQLVGVVFGASADGSSFVAPSHIIREILASPGATNAIPFSKRPRRASQLPVIKDADFRAGTQAWERRDWARASHCFSRLVRRYPNSPTAHLLLGISYRGLESWLPAKRALARAVQLKPHSSAAWLLYGSTLLALEQYADSAEALREALRLGLFEWHQAVTAWADLARASAGLGKVGQAQEALDRLAGLDRRRAAQLRAELQKRYPHLGWEDGPR